MLSFRQFLLEADDDWEETNQISWRTEYSKKIGKHNVKIYASDYDQNNHHSISYTVDDGFSKKIGTNMDKPTALSILTQVRDKIDKHVEEKKPNLVELSSPNATRIKLHDHYSKHLAKKYKGRVDKQRDGAMTTHTVYFKH